MRKSGFTFTKTRQPNRRFQPTPPGDHGPAWLKRSVGLTNWKRNDAQGRTGRTPRPISRVPSQCPKSGSKPLHRFGVNVQYVRRSPHVRRRCRSDQRSRSAGQRRVWTGSVSAMEEPDESPTPSNHTRPGAPRSLRDVHHPNRTLPARSLNSSRDRCCNSARAECHEPARASRPAKTVRSA